jgi:hypothetical protein
MITLYNNFFSFNYAFKGEENASKLDLYILGAVMYMCKVGFT